ncbi:glutathione S-transferase family protein [Roseospira marina]|uniref:Glutathione S-transferase family protein n=1 Tax=Roseospira marina TaxID=140057 RepID=A0A5M6I9Q4_9PROT|nr:glutathione S-transferase family protein [Roseospira marina]KAA5604687.1 glutathione S-transferase family protein [Roseospira marina]MBB4315134.1 glutathione S-transferase [Roseospira marina]MBB5088096.1 glutathione S-transferase [Roseospira marina]
MILVGRNLSPFTRRVLISMRILDVPFERRELATATQVEAIRAFNPLARVPALELDDGMVLIDSGAILDYLDEQAGPDRALTPSSGVERRRVLRHCALITGAWDKAVAAFYERSRRPAEMVYMPAVEASERQVADGLAAAEAERPAEGGWLLGGERPTQADITAAVALPFLRVVLPHLVPAGRYPRLEALLDGPAAHVPGFAESDPTP